MAAGTPVPPGLLWPSLANGQVTNAPECSQKDFWSGCNMLGPV